MKIAILTNAVYKGGLPEYFKLTDRSKAAYCARWGFSWMSLRADPRPDSHPVWAKPILMVEALEHHDWCVWIDGDAGITNQDFDLEGVLAASPAPIVMAEDINGYNAGVFAARKDAQNWLKTIDARRGAYTRRFREQQAMSDSIRAGEMACLIPPLAIGWNDYMPSLYGRDIDKNVWSEGRSWILHLPAVDDAKRADIFKGVL